MGREIPVVGDEFELSLELSIGGCYAKSENKNLERENGGDPPSSVVDSNNEIPRSDFSLGEIKTDAGAENSSEFPDLETRREIQASRRRVSSFTPVVSGDDRLILEAQQFHARVEERESRERDGVPEDSARKREKLGARKAAENLNVISLFGENKVSEAQFPLPVVNGFACPWVLPLWGNKAAAPAVSLHRSTSQKGGSCCSDSGSHSSTFGTSQNLDGNNSCIGGGASQDPSSSTSTNVVPSSVPKVLEPNTTKLVQGSSTMLTRADHEKPASTSPTTTTNVINKPPKLTQNARNMPIVSTTFNGKTITGFLHKYTKSEVTILCVCHGTFFTPAQFVEHAGAVNITHPLRHITVLPSLLQ